MTRAQRLLRNPIAIAFLAIFALILVTSTLVIVPETKQALIVRFGQPQTIANRFIPGERFGETNAGPILKVPFVDEVIWIDKRIQSVDMDRQLVLSSDQLRLQVDAFARYRITNPRQMYVAARTEENVQEALRPILASTLRNELGQQPFAALLSPERGQVMRNIRERLDRQHGTLQHRAVAQQRLPAGVQRRWPIIGLAASAPVQSAFSPHPLSLAPK